jgi:S1-C subfamily serine protease
MQVGDEILTLDGQAILSIADVQWVLHGAGETAELPALVRRDGKSERLALSLPEGWRQRDDLSWRVTTWELRRMGTGGLVLETATDEQRRAAGLDDDDSMALRVKYVGQYNEHAVGKNAGFREGDLIVQFGERTDLERETDLLAYAVQNTRPGEKVKVAVLRGRQRMVIVLPMQ